MKIRHYTLAALLALGTSFSASAVTSDSPAKLYSEYLAGSYANYIKDAELRSEHFSKAFIIAPKDVKLGRLALISAIQADDFAQAEKLAAKVFKLNKTESMSRATLGVAAFAKGKTSRADRYLKDPTSDLTAQILMSIVRGWNEVDKGNLDSARKIFGSIGGGSYFGAFGQLQIAKLEAGAGNYEAAETALKIIDEADLSRVETALVRARLLVAQGKKEDATTLLTEYADETDAYGMGPVPHMIAALESGETVKTKLTARQNAARALVDPAFAFFAANGSADGAELYLRFAREIDPDYDKARMWLGALLDDTNRKPEAFELYDQIDKSSPYFVSAQLNMANRYFADDDDDGALSVLERLVKSNPSFVTREAVGRARFFRENYEEALPFYDTLVQGMTPEELEKNTEPLRFRGIIYERLDKWDMAEADFKKVLSIDPDDVDTLNYLGYTWVDRGENLTEAFEMIRKAVEKEPSSGAIVDSLGWAHYKLGQYKDAKEKLEEAVVLSPSSATIIDHLGDAYWKVGRKRDAGYQWERALEYDPTDEERARINIKLKGGLEAAGASQ